VNINTNSLASRLLLNIPALTIIYILVGIPDLLSATHPELTTHPFLVAGISLVWLLLGGIGLWPGIFLGSLALNLWQAIQVGQPLSTLFFTAIFGIGLGYTLQALAGFFLIRRFMDRSNPMINIRETALFLLVLVPISCLLGPSIGLATLWQVDLIQVEKITFTWWSWWITDTMEGC
jgi:diguanylate cyclase